MPEEGYIDYFDVLGLDDTCKPGEVRKVYRKQMKSLLMEIHNSRGALTPERRDAYLLDLARHNAAYYILRDQVRRDRYVADRAEVIQLEDAWRKLAGQEGPELDRARRAYDGALRHFLSTYLEEYMLEAGRDPDCVEASNWDLAHERHAGRVLRHHRQRLYHEIHQRLPYALVTEPAVDWQQRRAFAVAVIAGKED